MFEPARSYDYFSVGGESFANGFDLEYSTVLGHTETFEFRLPDTEEHTSRRMDWGTAALFALLYVSAIRSHLFWPLVFLVYLLYRSTGALLERSYKAWHWVEHQAALWLEGELTDRFDDIDPISTRCGSTYIVAEALLLSSIVMVVIDHGWHALPVFVSAFATWSAFRNRVALPLWRPWIRRAMIAIAWPTASVCLIAQRIFFMRTPSDEQRIQARRWATSIAPIIARSLISDSPPRIRKYVRITIRPV